MGNYRFEDKSGLYKLVCGFCILGIFLCFSPYIDHYVTDGGVFLKHEIKAPYYIKQKPYDIPDFATKQIDGVEIHYLEKGEQIGYAPLPATSYIFMMERSELRGNSIEKGFKPRK